ncbi:MAG: hypothetical protein A2X31_04415 [Elusimicrobia bacterium GWB2_63_22]|nr:MAG: hypothetical protein A2X31_04415 [Elusimicrobia bacterium GWB2_63_22]
MIRRLLVLAALLPLPARAVAATIEGRDLGGGNLICGPGSAADDSIPCSPNDVLSGVFTNVGLFQVNAGTTVFVTPGVSLAVFASTIAIPGFLNGSGRGEVGGIGGDPGQPGGDGEGKGPGIGALINMGGGGGAYGGYGGDGSGTDGILGIGGNPYDDLSPPVSMGSLSQGSGGGGGGGAGEQTGGSGGQGGASIYLEAAFFTLTGSIFARGVPGGNSTKPADAGGGGAGGSLLLRCLDSAAVGGLINASGGKGGDAIAGGGDVPYPGGGGGGGRVKIYYRQAAITAVISTEGGAKGVKSANGPEGVPNAQPGGIGVVSFATVASPPADLTAPAVFATSITWNWAAAPDWGDAPPASRQYRLYSGTVSYRSPDRSPQFAADSGALSADETGLTPNTAYARYATAFTDHSDSLPSGLVSIHTLAGRPGAAASTFTAVTVYSLNMNWSAGEPANPGYTSYEVNSSTASNFGAGASVSYTAALSSGPAGLAPNTTYYFRVRAINLDALPTAFAPVVSTATLAADPGSPSFAGVTPTGFLLSWDVADNPPLTRYIAEVSTDNFATLVRSSSTLDPQAVFSGLAINTLYYARARAQNHNGIDTDFTATITTVTATSFPVSAPAPFTNLSAGALTFNWESGGNSAGTDYNPELSADSGFAALISSEVTTNLNYVFTGLSANATYYARVRALGSDGSASPYSSPAVSTVTLTPPPAPAEPAFTEVLGGSFTFSWENGGNPAGTMYTAEISRDGFVSVSSAVRTSALGAGFSALAANTVYQARVRAVNFAGIPGQYSSPIVSTATAISAAVNVASPFQNLSADALTFSWESGGNSAGTSYNPELSTSSNFSAPVSSAVTTSLNYLFTGLLPNATYYAHTRAVGVGGNPTPYTAAVSTVTYTLAPVVPASPFSGVSVAGFTLGWEPGGNPPNTRYAAEISRDSFATLTASASTLLTSASFSGLAPNTVYQVRARALNFLGIAGPYSGPLRSTATLAAPPQNAGQPFTAVSAGTVTFTWEDGGNPGGTSYAVEISSAAFAPGTAVSSAATLALSQTFGGLLANTAYQARVRAVNRDGIASGYAAAVAAVTLPLAPAPAAPPFSGVSSSGLTLGWTANGNPQGTTYVAELSRDNFVTVLLSSTTLSIPASFAGLTPNTTYTARIKAVNSAGDSGPYSTPIVSTATLAVPAESAVPSFSLTDSGLTALWLAGGNPQGTRYETEVSTRPGFETIWASASVSGLSETFALAPNTTYYARVRARNHNGIPTALIAVGSGLATYAALPAVAASTAPGPVSVTTFTFTNSVTTGTGGLVFYRTVWDRNATHTWNDQEPGWAALEVLTTTATGNGYWYLHLRSYNFNGLGHKTADVGPFHVALSTVIPPGQPVPVPGAFTATSGITWNWPPAIAFGETIVSTYVVSVGTTPSDFNVLADSAIGPLTSFTLDPATNGRTYYLKVRAIDEGGILSQYSPVSSPGVLVDRSVPEQPGTVQADREFSYDSNILFSWAPSADEESGIKAYLLDAGTSLYGTDIFNAKDLGQELSYQATGLPGGKSVYARVRAENNAGGFSEYSEPGAGIPVLPLAQTAPMTQPYNWPNPFDPGVGPTQIGFFLKDPARVTLKLFTLEGNLVYEETRAEGEAGNKVWPWTGRNGAGKMTAPGGYICLIEKRYSGKTERQQFKLAVLY